MDHAGNADPDFGHAEFGVVRGDPEVAGGGEFEPAAEAPAGHSRDHRRRKHPHRFTEVAQAGDEFFRGGLIELCHLLDIGAADHALFALAGDHQHPNWRFGREPLQPLAEAVYDGRSEDVERAGVADRQADDAARVAIDAAIGIEHVHGWSRALPSSI